MELVKASSPVLRRKSVEVKDIGSITELARGMVDYLVAHSADEPSPVSVAAPQLGHLVRIIAFRINASPVGDIQVLINPTLVYGKGFHVVREGCLSLPGKAFMVRRHKTVKIRGWTLDDKLRSFRGRDFLAQIFEHEINHLDGILVDKVGEKVK